MPAGNLRTSLQLEKRRQAPDETDGITSVFDTVGDAWGSVRQVKAGTYQDGQQVGEGVTHTIRIRWRPTTDFNFIRSGEQRFRVLRLGDPDGRRRWVDIFAEEIRPGEDA